MDRLSGWMDGSDAAVVAQVCAGDSSAFRVLVDRHSRAVFRLAYRMTGSREDAEDIVQETFMRAYRQIRTFEAQAAMGTWIYRIAANCAVDLLRRRKRQPLCVEPGDRDGSGAEDVADPNSLTADRLAQSAEIRRRVRDALGLLSPSERIAFVMRHQEGQPIEEIARTMGIRVGAAKHCIFRAVRKLRRALEPLASVKA